MTIKKILVLTFAVFGVLFVNAQEFRSNVTIQAPTLQQTDPKVFQTLKGTIEEYFNNTRFTEQEFEEFEKIDLEVNMTISEEISNTRFKVDFAIQATRPVYGSNYDTPIFTHVDKDFAFNYEQFQPIDFSENAFISNLSSLLTFYAYMVLAYDGDSFAPYGGEPYVQQALVIVNNIPQNLNDALRKGWSSLDGTRNRYWLLDGFTSPRLRDFRQAWYDYHRQGLDITASDVTTGRAVIAESVRTIGQVNRNQPNSMILQVFANTKASELVEIFKQGTPDEQNLLIQTMTKVDPANAAKYRKVR